MKEIERKYNKYWVRYDEERKIVYVGKPIAIVDFCRLKLDIAMSGIQINNLIVEGR